MDEIVGFKVGICVHSYFRMPDDGSVACAQKLLVILGGEHPVTAALVSPIPGGYPPFSLVRMPALRPLRSAAVTKAQDLVADPSKYKRATSYGAAKKTL